MARKLEEVLRAKGYSDTDLEALKPMLTDAKFRSTLEDSLGEVESERDKFKGEAEGWSSWYKDTGLPTVEKALKDAQDARATAAAHEARLKTLQEQGLIKIAEETGEKVTPKPPEAPVFDPKAHNLVTMDDVTKFADAEGEAIASAQDLAAEYHELFGKSLFSYQGADGSRGFRALRKEALAAKQPISQYVAGKFKFDERRQEIAAK